MTVERDCYGCGQVADSRRPLFFCAKLCVTLCGECCQVHNMATECASNIETPDRHGEWYNCSYHRASEEAKP
jgi:hypothetical protein